MVLCCLMTVYVIGSKICCINDCKHDNLEKGNFLLLFYFDFCYHWQQVSSASCLKSDVINFKYFWILCTWLQLRRSLKLFGLSSPTLTVWRFLQFALRRKKTASYCSPKGHTEFRVRSKTVISGSLGLLLVKMPNFRVGQELKYFFPFHASHWL